MVEEGEREKWRKRLRKRVDEREGGGAEGKTALLFIEDDLVEIHKKYRTTRSKISILILRDAPCLEKWIGGGGLEREVEEEIDETEGEGRWDGGAEENKGRRRG